LANAAFNKAYTNIKNILVFSVRVNAIVRYPQYGFVAGLDYFSRNLKQTFLLVIFFGEKGKPHFQKKIIIDRGRLMMG